MKDLPVRKNIRLNGYDYSQAGYYYVTICVKDRLELLGKLRVGDDAHIVPPYIELSLFGEIAKKYIESIHTSYADIYVDNYIIMPDHIHLILVIRKSAIILY